MDQSPEGLLRPCCKNLTKKDEVDVTKLSNLLTLPTLIVGHGPFNNLTGHSRHPPRQCPISANAIFLQLIRNGEYETKDCETTRLVRKETSELWKIPTPNGSSLTREFSPPEFADAFQKLKQAKPLVVTKYDPSLYSMLDPSSDPGCANISLLASDGVEYSAFKYEYRVLALRTFEYEYWWLTTSTSTGDWLRVRVPSTFLQVKLYTLKSIAGICCINWNQFSWSCSITCLLPLWTLVLGFL